METGPGSTLEGLRGGLGKLGYRLEDIGDVLVTHIHLDHSGGAWALARAGARVHVPERGARHLVDPTRLVESARMVYGDRFDALWGEVRAIPEWQVNALGDGAVVVAGGVRFGCWDSPGHAWHHQVFECGEVAFVGDAAGCRLPGERFLALTSAPPQFDPVAWKGTMERLAGAGYARIYPTHFGPVDDVADHLARYREVVRESSAFVRGLVESGVGEVELRERYGEFCRERAECGGCGGRGVGAVRGGESDGDVRGWDRALLAEEVGAGIIRAGRYPRLEI